MRSREDRNAYVREWKRKHRERVNEAARRRYAEKPPDRRAYRRAWYRKHLTKERARARAYIAAHRDERRAYALRYDAAKPELKRARRRRYWLANRKKEAAQKRAWLKAHPGYHRERYHAQPEKRRAQARARYAANTEVMLARNRAWRRTHRDVMKRHKDRRRALLAAAPVVDRLAIYERDGGKCHLCRRRVSRKTFTLDHLVPLSRGGAHAAFNLAVAHRRCNSRKHDHLVPVQSPAPPTRPG